MSIKIFAVLLYNIFLFSESLIINDADYDRNISSVDSHYFIYFEQHQQIVKTVSDKFLSFGLGVNLLRNNMKNLPVDNEKFINLAQHLKPAHLRIGGTAADVLYFDEKITSKKDMNTMKNYLSSDGVTSASDISNFTFTGEHFLSLFKFSQVTGTKLLFDLNVLLRKSDGSWNSDNPKKIILFAKAHGMKLDWQLGNEPNSYNFTFNTTISANQLSKDYCKLRKILNKAGYVESLLVGPEANRLEKCREIEYVEGFLKNINDCVDYVTWHQYYLNGHTAKIEDFVNPSVFNRLPTTIKSVQEAIRTSGKNISMWISETSSAYGGGVPELSDRYIDGFLWLDKLGVCAKAGVEVVIRETFFGSSYAIVGPDLEPNPDWWVSVLFKKLVSEKVLNLITPDNNLGKVRLYAHCAVSKISLPSLVTPQIIIYGMNLNNRNTKIYLGGVPTERTRAFAFFLTSDNNLRSRNIILNGKVLKLENNGNLPHLNPQVINISQPIELPPYSMIFLLLSDLEFSPC